MKQVGIVFLVINLLLAGAFLGYSSFALKVSTNWQQKHAELQASSEAKAQEAAALQSKLTTELEAVTNSRDLLQETKNKAEATIKSLTAELEASRRENSELNSQVAGINAQIGELKDTIAQVTEAKSQAEEQRVEAEKAAKDALADAKDAVRAQRDAEAALASANDQIAQLKVDLTNAGEDNASKQALLAMYQEKTGIAIGELGPVQKLINGRVVSVNSSFNPGLVALNVGSEAGVSRGMTFEIWAGSEYKGQVRVETVLPDKCSAVIVRQSGGAIVQGDYAATNL